MKQQLKNNLLFILIVLGLCVFYSIYLTLDQKEEKQVNAPVISYDSDIVEVSVQDDQNVLLEDVRALDKEDGNISDMIVIEDISSFDENKERKVTYAVYDYDDHKSTAIRNIHYKDYTPPAFQLLEPLITFFSFSEEDLQTMIKAYSCIDGDISRNVKVSIVAIDSIEYAKYEVTDSSGTTSSLLLKISRLSDEQTYKINLTDYYINVPVGYPLDPRAYLESITNNGMAIQGINYMVQIDTDYNPEIPGLYEFVYHLNRNGEFGATKLVVNVVG